MNWPVCVLLGVLGVCSGERWAVLVAGSSGWHNYRHQADVCHAYHVLTQRGVPKSNIITFMYDDIAHNPQNPMPGKIVNQPSGPDVYQGVTIDYRGNDVNKKNFFHVLLGNSQAVNGTGTGKVVKSGPEDTVFIFFSDHGGVGSLSFPNELLLADELEKVLSQMVSAKPQNKILFYVEACEAGSMFDGILEENKHVLVSTAAARDEQSQGWYCHEKFINTCLGDLFSITWLQHMDQLDIESGEEYNETLFHQYDRLRTRVVASHVNLYGDYRLGFHSIGIFMGDESKGSRPKTLPVQHLLQYNVKAVGVLSRSVPVHTAFKSLHSAPQTKKLHQFKQLIDLIKKRVFGDKTINDIVKLVSKGDDEITSSVMNSKFPLNKEIFPCYRRLLEEFNQTCFNLAKNNYLMKHFYVFVNMCSLPQIKETDVIGAIRDTCSVSHRNITNMH